MLSCLRDSQPWILRDVVAEATRYQSWHVNKCGKPTGLRRAAFNSSKFFAVYNQAVAAGRRNGDGRHNRCPAGSCSVMVAEGTFPRTLRIAAGHIPGTALPGKPGNVAIAAHRDTFFRRLGDLKSGDLIRITVPGRQYIYSVRSPMSSVPTRRGVLEPFHESVVDAGHLYPFTTPVLRGKIRRPCPRMDGE